jgi:hypothetical protein
MGKETIVKPTTLLKYIKSITFGNEQKLPFMPGSRINSLIEHYKIPAIQWGYEGSLIGIETKKQFMIWRDKGYCMEFKGLMNKSDMAVA